MAFKEDVRVTGEKKEAIGGAAACERKEKEWKKPVLEDVSDKVMAQPYIRFT